MKTIELDLTGCKYLDEIHEKSALLLNFLSGMEKIGVHFGICFGVNVMPIR